MKKKISVYVSFLLAALFSITGCNTQKKPQEKESLIPVTLNEVAHSIFYAPQYTAIEKGYFAEEGLDLTLKTGFGADKTMTAVLSGEADIGFMGAEASVYAYQNSRNLGVY